MVLLWTQRDEDVSKDLSPTSSSFLSSSKSSATSPGTIVNSSYSRHAQVRILNKPPLKPQFSPCGRSSLSPSSILSSSGDSSSGYSSPGDKLVVALRNVGRDTPRKVELSRTLSACEPKTSTPNGVRMGAKIKNTNDDDCVRKTLDFDSRGSSSDIFSASEIDVTRTPVLASKHAEYFKSLEDTCRDSKIVLQNQKDQENSVRKPLGRKDRKRFNSLPRNWRGKAVDFIWSRGEFLPVLLSLLSFLFPF